MVSNASDDLPEPLKPVMTTNLPRGIVSDKFLRLCWRAPPILMNSIAMAPQFRHQDIWLAYPDATGMGNENEARLTQKRKGSEVRGLARPIHGLRDQARGRTRTT